MDEDFDSGIRSICPRDSEEADAVFIKRKKKGLKSKSRVDILCERREAGLDLWTGEPLAREEKEVVLTPAEQVRKIFTWGD